MYRAILILTLFCGTLLADCGCKNKGSTEYVTIANQVSRQTATLLEDQFGLHFATKGGFMPGDVRLLFLGLTTDQLLDIAHARSLLLQAAEIYLDQINSDEKLQPYLHDYPFTVNNIKLEISYAVYRNITSSSQVAQVALRDGVITYWGLQGYSLAKLQQETYEAALQANVQ